MAVYSTNQNRQFYVVTRFVDGSNSTTSPKVGTANTQVGDIEVKCINDGLDKEFFFTYKGVDTVLRSDRIPLKNLNYIKAISAWDMITPLKKVTVTLNSAALYNGAPIPGDYVLRIEFRQFHGMSDQDVYIKDVAVHAYSGMTKQQFYEAMRDALFLSFSREVGATKTSNPYLDFTADSSSLCIWEKDQTPSWVLGTDTYEPVHFDVYPTTIQVGLDEVTWGTAEVSEKPLRVLDTNSESATYNTMIPNTSQLTVGTNAVGNGTKIADMEYFYMGERADQYRNVGWPNVITTKLLVDATQQYNVLEIHYAFTDTGVNSYRSEKDITIVVPVGASGHENDVINALIGAINTATGLSVATL